MVSKAFVISRKIDAQEFLLFIDNLISSVISAMA